MAYKEATRFSETQLAAMLSIIRLAEVFIQRPQRPWYWEAIRKGLVFGAVR